MMESSTEICLPGQSPQSIMPGDFFLLHGEGFFSRLIQFGQSLRFRGKDRQFSYFTHAGIFINGQGDMIEADSPKIVQQNISFYKNIRYIVVHTNCSIEDGLEAVAFAQSCVGEEYDWFDIFSIALSLLTGLKISAGFNAHQICSGLVAKALERTKAIFPLDDKSITPGHLAKYFNVTS